MKSRKKFTKDFKISVLRELENSKTAAQICREHDIHPTMLSKWKKEYKIPKQLSVEMEIPANLKRSWLNLSG